MPDLTSHLSSDARTPVLGVDEELSNLMNCSRSRHGFPDQGKSDGLCSIPDNECMTPGLGPV